MQESLGTPLRRVDHELVTALGWSLDILDEPWHDRPGLASAWLVSVTGSRTGIFVDETDDEEVRTVSLAGQVQDFVHEDLPARGQTAVWPGCPLHPATHPLSPTLHEGQAWWECPRTRRPVRPLGEGD